jgi:hypothetical protein
MKKRGCFLAVLVIGMICAAGTNAVFAQVSGSGAQLSGTVRDASAGAVAKTSLTLRNTDTNRMYSETTAETGYYVMPGVVPGNYELVATATGFAKTTRTGIVLTVGQVATIDVELKVAEVGANIEVTTEVPVIETTKTEISQVIATQQIASLPISGRLFTDFALLTPGVATSRTSLGTTFTDFETTQISFGGMRSFSNEITVDGADFVAMITGVQRSTPPQESAQEFRVVNNSFGAENGRAAGGIVNIVTKSGTNTLHGSVYGYLQNSAADARSLLQPSPLPHELRQGQYGGTLGGPIQKDKTFFFINYEGKRRAESPIYPPDLINNLTVIDEAKQLMGLAPEGCSAPLSECSETDAARTGYLNGFLKTANDDWGFARIDHQFGSNHQVAIRYNVEDTRALGELVGSTLDGGGIGVPSGGRNLFIRDQSLFGTLNSVLKPNLINTALVQYARRHYGFPGATGQPDFSLLNDLELGHNFGTQDRDSESRIQFSDSLSWVKGKHTLNFGFDGNYIWNQFFFPGFTPVRLLVPAGVPCLASFAKFYTTSPSNPNPVTLGPTDPVALAAPNCPVPNGVAVVYAGVPLPADPNFTSGPPLVTAANPLDTSTWANAFPPSLASNYTKTLNHGYWGGFVQDRWRVNSKLTVNYGVRWDFESGISSIVKRDYKGWQPRVGLAYSPDSKTVIRAGFGMFDDRYNLTFFFVPNTQKVSPGYLCGNHPSAALASACSAAGVLPQNLTFIESNLGQASQGYQLFAFPASQGAADKAASVIGTGGYDAFAPGGNITMSGVCGLNGACGVGSGGVEHNSRIPYAEQASMEIDRQFGAGFALSLSYLFVEAHHLIRGNNINIPCPVGTTKSGPPTDPLTPAFLGGNPEWAPGLINADGSLSACTGQPTLGSGAIAGLGPFFGGAVGSGLQTISSGLMDYNNGVANAVYHGLTVTAIEKVGKHFNMTANYTYSHTLDNGNFTTFINLPVNEFDDKAERANSNQDLRHHFVANFTASTPTTGWYRDFEFSSIITAQSGRPFTIFYGQGTLNDLASGAIDRVGGGSLAGPCQTVDTCSTMIPRNTYFGDQLYSWDLRVSHGFHVREHMTLELMLDVFNVFNRPNVDEVGSVYGSPIFCGAIPGHYKDATSLAIGSGGAAAPVCPQGDFPLGPSGLAPSFASTPLTPPATSCLPTGATCLFIPVSPNTTFGQPRTMFNPRQLQVGLKLSF